MHTQKMDKQNGHTHNVGAGKSFKQKYVIWEKFRRIQKYTCALFSSDLANERR